MTDEQAKTAERQRHWETIYRAKADAELSWHQDDPSVSLQLISEVARPDDRIVDIGGGASALVGRLMEHGLENVAVLDISPAALERAKARVGREADRIRWIVADVTEVEEIGTFNIWHDRAVFHFLTDEADRRRYLALAERTVPAGGHVVIATFGPEGPDKCSGLPVQRHDHEQLAAAFGDSFRLRGHRYEEHRTPWGKVQQFVYAVLEKVA